MFNKYRNIKKIGLVLIGLALVIFLITNVRIRSVDSYRKQFSNMADSGQTQPARPDNNSGSGGRESDMSNGNAVSGGNDSESSNLGNNTSGSNNSGNDDSGNNSQNTRPAGKVISCTIEIRCDNATARKDTVNPSIASRIPDDGTILEVTTYTAVEGFTVYDVLAAVTAMHDPVIPIVANSDKSYVSSINNLSEKNVGPQSGWTYRVDGKLYMIAANNYTVKDGEAIKWIYVCQMGDM